MALVMVAMLYIPGLTGTVFLSAQQQKSQLNDQRKVTGTVMDEQGITLPGVNILINGTKTGTLTDVDGKFSINVPGEKYELTFSYVGFLPQTISISGKNQLKVQLLPDNWMR